MNLEEFSTWAADSSAIIFSEEPVAQAELDQAEQFLGLVMDAKFKQLCLAFGSGDIGFLDVCSLHANSRFSYDSLRSSSGVPDDIFPISADGTGAYWVQPVSDGYVKEEVVYWDRAARSVLPSVYADVFEFIVALTDEAD